MGLSRKSVIYKVCWGLVFMVSAKGNSLVNSEEAHKAPRKFFIDVGSATTRLETLHIDSTGIMSGDFKHFTQVIADDLNFSDYMTVIKPQRSSPSVELSKFTKADRLRHKVLGSTLALKVKLDRNKQNLEAAIFNSKTGEQIRYRQFKTKTSLTELGWRRLAHKVSDFVVESLTGEPGIYQSKMLVSCGKKLKEIYVADYDGYAPMRLTHDKNIALAPSWNREGDRILFTSFKPTQRGKAQNPNLYMIDLKHKRRHLVSATRGLNTGGAFHPFQNLVAYTHSKKGKAEVFLLDLLSKSRRVITKSFYFSVEPSWSPKGDQLTFSSSASGRPHIYVSDREGRSPRRLTFAGHYNSSPNWSPVADKIVFSGQENKKNNFNIFIIDANGSNLQRLTQGVSSNENPHFSPDGRYVSFASNREGAYKIYAMSLKRLKPRLITPRGLGECKDPAWSPVKVTAF